MGLRAGNNVTDENFIHSTYIISYTARLEVCIAVAVSYSLSYQKNIVQCGEILESTFCQKVSQKNWTHLSTNR
jgi:hypothetical protein